MLKAEVIAYPSTCQPPPRKFPIFLPPFFLPKSVRPDLEWSRPIPGELESP